MPAPLQIAPSRECPEFTRFAAPWAWTARSDHQTRAQGQYHLPLPISPPRFCCSILKATTEPNGEDHHYSMDIIISMTPLKAAVRHQAPERGDGARVVQDEQGWWTNGRAPTKWAEC